MYVAGPQIKFDPTRSLIPACTGRAIEMHGKRSLLSLAFFTFRSCSLDASSSRVIIQFCTRICMKP